MMITHISTIITLTVAGTLKSMTYEEFQNHLINTRDETCQELFGKNYEDLCENEAAQYHHAVAGAWITYKMQKGEII